MSVCVLTRVAQTVGPTSALAFETDASLIWHVSLVRPTDESVW